ncbi:MAG: hypothetical protein CMF82_03865 [Candidatus Marinimicrobia bacterium]|nr:hypothetical protein [Candidatus Neomarinimicrobiota bacterium]|tara:strand:+ start:8886 stop:9317 length:432 start_codon:yes stop_codon:yes gene_type:complete
MFSSLNNKYIKTINDSKFLAGVTMLMLNVGAKYVSIGLSKSQELYLTSTMARQLLIFSVLFIATKDVIASVVLTIVFVLFADYIFNENSKLCLLPHSMRKVKDEIDVDKDGIISDEELNNAIEILSKAKKKKQDQAHVSNYLK